MNEAQIQQQIVGYLRLKGWVVFETSQRGHSWATPGLPDVIAIKGELIYPKKEVCPSCYLERPRTLWIECKGPKNKQTLKQVQAQIDLEDQGAEYLVARSYEEVEAYLKGKE